MPPEGIPAPKDGNLLTNDEIVALVQITAREGVRCVRLTGGEPLLRRGVVDLVRALVAIQSTAPDHRNGRRATLRAI